MINELLYKINTNEIYFALFLFLIALGFILLLKKWYSRTRMWVFPSLTYWILGLFIIPLAVNNILSLIYESPANYDYELSKKNIWIPALGIFDALFPFVVYLFLGIRYFRSKKKPKS